MTDDQLLEKFFAEARQAEVPDNGFTERVMSRVPTGRAAVLSRLWTVLCVAVAAVLFVALRGWDMIAYVLMMTLNNAAHLQNIILTAIVLGVVIGLLAISELFFREHIQLV